MKFKMFPELETLFIVEYCLHSGVVGSSLCRLVVISSLIRPNIYLFLNDCSILYCIVYTAGVESHCIGTFKNGLFKPTFIGLISLFLY